MPDACLSSHRPQRQSQRRSPPTLPSSADGDRGRPPTDAQ